MILLVLLGLSAFAQNQPPEPRFDTAVVIPGGGMNFPVVFGVLEGLKERGITPDVLITSCGTSVGAALANSFSERSKLDAFLASVEFTDLMGSIKSPGGSFLNLNLALGKMVAGHTGLTDRIPDLFNNPFMALELDKPGTPLAEPLSSSHGIRVVMTGAQYLFDPSEAGQARSGRKLFREILMTDPDTAKSLFGIQATVAKEYPESAVAPEIGVRTDFTRGTAARISISDMHLFKPVRVNNETFVTGAIDLYPIDVAKVLARKLIVAIPHVMNVSGLTGIGEVFRFNTNDYRKRMVVRAADAGAVMIDLTDMPRQYRSLGLSRISGLREKPVPSFGLFRMMWSTASNPEKGAEIISTLRAYGQSRTLEGLDAPVGSLRHIRALGKGCESYLSKDSAE